MFQSIGSQRLLSPASSLRAPTLVPAGNADTITNALGPFRNQAERNLIFGAAQTGFFTYDEPSCGGQVSDGGQSYGKALASAGLGSVPVIGGFLQSALGIFGAHHAAAVQKEQGTLCAEVPDFNAFLRSVDQSVGDGGLDVGAATQVLESAYGTFVSRLKPIFKSCNAACVYEKAARAAVEKRKQDYAIIAANGGVVSQGVMGGVSATAPSSVYSGSGGGSINRPSPANEYASVAKNVSPFGGGVVHYGASPASTSPAPVQAGFLSNLPPGQVIGLTIVAGLMVSVAVALYFRGGSK